MGVGKDVSDDPANRLERPLTTTHNIHMAPDPTAATDKNHEAQPTPYELVDFCQLPAVSCPCGQARRAFADVEDFPGTIHVTEIQQDACLHYHKRLTEVYYFLECESDAKMQLDDQQLAVEPGLCLLIRPGTRHRAIGKMKVLIVVFPKFDAADEWFD